MIKDEIQKPVQIAQRKSGIEKRKDTVGFVLLSVGHAYGSKRKQQAYAKLELSLIHIFRERPEFCVNGQM